ncbi:MAG TPA: glucokinase [Anaerolineales bacterium]|nr:glucokinase [Anaerolineales bacterium]
MNVLIGDIGGTKTILAVFSTEAGPRKPLAEKSYPSAGYESLEAIIAEFLMEVHLPVQQACFGVAGPVVDGSAQITNLPWVISIETIKSNFKWTKVALLNDLEAVAYAISILEPEDVLTLSAGEPVRDGNVAVLAPGTGLGEAFLTFQGGRYRAHASEGSHASFAPAGKLQLGLLEFIHAQGHEHVSFERVCSGGLGIPNLYAYLKSIQYAEEPAWLTEKLAISADPSPVIFNAAQDASHPCDLAVATLDLFVAILGAEAGNLALKVLSTGGIYLGGGISPRIINELKRPGFLESIRSKGRFRDLLTKMPVHVILNSKAGLLGAAVYGLSS